MPRTNSLRNGILLLFGNNTDFANVGDAAGLQNSAADGSLYWSLHTADPGAAGSQTTSEATYTSYARQAASRTGSTGLTVSGNSMSNTGVITFPTSTGGSNDITHWGLGTALSGAGVLLWYGCLGTVFQGAFTATVADVFTAPGHTLANDERVALYGIAGTSLPTGITEGTIYWVVGVSGDTFQVSTTQGGAAVNITVAGDGLAFEATVATITSGLAPTIAAGAAVISEAA